MQTPRRAWLFSLSFVAACTSPSADTTNPPPTDSPTQAPVEVEPTPPNPDAGTPLVGGVFVFERVLALDTYEHPEGVQWSASMAVGVPEALEHLLDGYDGVERTFDPQAEGFEVPVTQGTKLHLVTGTGIFEREITGFGLYRMMDDDLLTMLLGPLDPDAGQGPGLAILSRVPPHAAARLVPAKAEPPDEATFAVLEADYAGAKAQLVANFEPMDEPGDRAAVKAIELSAECVELYRPQMPAGYSGIVAVECGGEAVYEPRLSALLMVGDDGKLTSVGQYDGWSFGYGASELFQLVDLDGDGLDELIVHDAGYEYFAERYLAWKDGVYQRFGDVQP